MRPGGDAAIGITHVAVISHQPKVHDARRANVDARAALTMQPLSKLSTPFTGVLHACRS